MKAKKDNKVYTINTDQEKQRYLSEGFDVYDDQGSLLEHSPLKKIAYSEYSKLLKEKEELSKQVKNLKKQLSEANAEGKDDQKAGK